MCMIYLSIPLLLSRQFRKKHFALLQAESKSQKKKFTEINQIWLALPAFLDTLNTTLKNIALLLLPASIQQMLLGGTIITACIVSRVMLKRQMEYFHWIGNILALTGFALAGYSSVLNDSDQSDSNTWNNIIGITLIVIELFFSALQTNIEEWIFHQNAIHVARGTGLEGFFGMIWSFSSMAVFSYISCPRSSMCDISG